MLDVTLSKKVAYQILSHFDKSYRWFTRITRGAQSRFEQGQWKEIQLASKERITIYEQSLSDAVADVYHLTEVHKKKMTSFGKTSRRFSHDNLKATRNLS